MSFYSRFVVAAGGIALLGAIVWAFDASSFAGAWGVIFAEPWGVVAMIDLYLGFILFATVIWFFEPSAARALPWIIALMVLGNIVSAVWLLVNGPQLAKALAGR